MTIDLSEIASVRVCLLALTLVSTDLFRIKTLMDLDKMRINAEIFERCRGILDIHGIILFIKKGC